MARISQEFYCTVSGGGCGGYFTVRLNMALNGVVKVICPKCNHEHQRSIKDGVLTEEGRHTGKIIEEILPTVASWSKKPRHPESKKRSGSFHEERQAVVLDESWLKRSGSLWFERFGSRE